MAEYQTNAAAVRQEINSYLSKARQTVKELFDEGTFLEKSTYIKDGEGILEGIITGGGSVDNRPVFAAIQDKDNENAGFTNAQAKKINYLYDTAIKAGAPIVVFFENSGAKTEQGVSLLSAYASVLKKSSEAKGIIPQIAVVKGSIGGAEAVICSGFDLVIAADDAKYHVGANKSGESGIFDIICPENELVSRIKEALSYFPSSCYEINAVGEADPEINTLLDLENAEGDVHELINALSDTKPLYIKEGNAPEAVTAFITLNGRKIGCVANQPILKDGILTREAAEKISRFVNTLGCFNIPVLTLINSGGYSEGENGYAEALKKLGEAYLNCESTKVSVFAGKSCGFAPQLLGSKETGSDFVFALDGALISLLPPNTAVEFMYENELKASSDVSKEREALKKKYISENCSPINYAKDGQIDDIIPIGELKMRVASVLEFFN